MKVLMVCMGNICRSPTLEGVFRHHLQQAGLAAQATVDSAGTHAYHVGEAPDSRSQQHARQRGYDLSQQRARQVTANDFDKFDLLLAADKRNLALLQQHCPAHLQHKLKLAMHLAPHLDVDEVPDPYYGGASGFETVLDYAEAVSAALLSQVQAASKK